MAIDISSMDRLSRVMETPSDAARAAAVSPIATAAPVASTSAPVSSTEVAQAVQVLQQAVKSGPNPDFSLDYLSGLSVVTVRSDRTGEVVFQLPDTRALELARLIKDGSSLASVGLLNFTA